MDFDVEFVCLCEGFVVVGDFDVGVGCLLNFCVDG